MALGGADPRYFIGDDRHSDPGAAQQDPAFKLPLANRRGEVKGDVRVHLIVAGNVVAEIHDPIPFSCR
jgi:hypothetical protein